MAVPFEHPARALLRSPSYGARRAALTLACALAVAVASRAAAAETPQQIAESHFRAGLKLYDAGSFEAARLEYLQAQAVFPRASVLRNLALCELKTGRPLEALQHLRAYLAEPGSDNREFAKKNLDDAYARTAHLVVRAADGAALAVDGRGNQGNAPFREPIDLLPGKHLLEATLGDRKRSREIDAPAGTNTDVDLRFEDDKSGPAVTAAPAPGRSVTEPPREEPRPSMATRNIVSGSLGVVGVTSVIIGTVFLSKAEGNITDAKALTPGDPTFRTLGDEYSSNQSAGWVGVGVGAALLTGAVATFFLWPKTEASRASVRPLWLGTGAGVTGDF